MTKKFSASLVAGALITALAAVMPVSAFALTLNSSNISIVTSNSGAIFSSTNSTSQTGGNTAGGSKGGNGGNGGSASSSGSSTTPTTGCSTTTTTVVSDTSNIVVPANTNAVAVSMPYNAAWTASIPGATWIWNADPQPSPVVFPTTVAFEKSFTVPGTVQAATLQIAADNSYTGNVNGTTVDNSANAISSGASVDNFEASTQDTYDVVNAVTSGTNKVHFEVTNTAGSTDPLQNPGGLLYKLVVTSQVCPANTQSTGGNSGGNGGKGGSSGPGGVVITGPSTSKSVSVNVTNFTRTNIH